MTSIELTKIPINTDKWQRVLFLKGVYKIIPSSKHAVKMRVGTETEASVVVDNNFILIIENIEEYKEFKGTISDAFFYYYDLNEVKDFIEIVENNVKEFNELKQDYLNFKDDSNKEIKDIFLKLDKITQNINDLTNRVTNLEKKVDK